MKTKFFTALAAVSLLLTCSRGAAAGNGDVTTEIKALVAKVQTKLKQGKQTEQELAPELKEFDALLAKHKDEKTDEVAQILYMKAALYSQVLNNETKSKELLEQLKRDFPDSKTAASLKRQEEAEKIQAGLREGAKFPDFNEKDMDGKPLSIANLKGKVVLIDFWATWCGPCVAELPNVQKAYTKHHANGFEIIGISLDSDKVKLQNFIKQRKMVWPQFFDGEGWGNKLAQKYGVNSIPATYLLDGEGKIIAKDLRGDDLEAAVAKALAKK